jgi:hypothetical protein
MRESQKWQRKRQNECIETNLLSYWQSPIDPIHEEGSMPYWVKRIVLKSGEILTEKELRSDENFFEGAPPVVGETITAACRGRSFSAKVIWGNWPGRNETRDEGETVPLRVEEI